jgi:PIN domain nuclease of toxin-antitoxin system
LTSSIADSDAAYVVDTHVLLWYIAAQAKLSARVRAIFETAERGEVHLFLSAITAAELFWIYAKKGIAADFPGVLSHLMSLPFMTFVPLEAKDTLEFARDAAVAEMHDRIIVGLAKRLSVPLITVDGQIRASATVPVVW